MTGRPTSEPARGTFVHAIDALELGGVLDYIASKCGNRTAADRVRALRPGTDRAVIESSLDDIGELVEYHAIEGRLPGANTGPQEAIRRAASDGAPVPVETLLEIAVGERTGAELVRALGQLDGFERLKRRAEGLDPQTDLAADINRCIERDGTIKDSASPRLKELRRGAQHARAELRRFTDKLAKSYGSVEYATYTGDRYMLVVPRERLKGHDGIVHSTSHSGGSLYYEPFQLVRKNNHLETILIDGRAEEARILGELAASVIARADVLLMNYAVLDDLDALDARARFAGEFRCARPVLSADHSVRLRQARHPLLELSLREAGDADGIVPLDVVLEPGRRVMVITGPNAGGKTVTLKTIGLLTLMMQCGIPVPAGEGSELGIFDDVFADIGDEQSISASLSTFTSHLRHMDAMCRGATPATLCLVDEIGDGTDPEEGAALAIATLEFLLRSGATVVATTHYGKVKTFALDAAGVSNASMLFDDADDRPLYRLLQGTAGRSRGLDTAKRMQFVQEIIERAQSLVGAETFRLEELLSELESGRLALERERDSVERRSSELNALRSEYEGREHDLREHRDRYEADARREAEDVLLRARREIEAIVKSIRETQASKAAVREGHAKLEKLLDTVKGAKKAASPAPRRKVKKVVAGARVSLSPSGRPSGIVVGVRRSQAVIDMNGKTVNASIENLYEAEDADRERPDTVNVDVDVKPLESTTVDVRGQDRETALDAVDRLIDGAVLNGVGEVTVIHGVGEEILLGAVRARLEGDPRVSEIREGRLREGGRGVTVVILK